MFAAVDEMLEVLERAFDGEEAFEACGDFLARVFDDGFEGDAFAANHRLIRFAILRQPALTRLSVGGSACSLRVLTAR